MRNAGAILVPLLLAGCAHPPERIERDAALEKAVEPCLRQYYGSRITAIVPALINGVPATMLLDTGASFTIVHPKLAQRAGIEIPLEARRVRTVVVGGGQIRMPLARARSLSVQQAAVEAIDVAVYDALPRLEGVDGILGNNFLNHFTLTVDRQNRTLLLVPLGGSKPL